MGTVCIYQATDAEAIWRHAKIADLPVDEIVPVADTVICSSGPRAGSRLKGADVMKRLIIVVLSVGLLPGDRRFRGSVK